MASVLALRAAYTKECTTLSSNPSRAILFFLERLEKQTKSLLPGDTPRTQAIDLSYSSLDSAAIIPFASALCSFECSGISTLNLAFNQIDIHGIQAIASMLSQESMSSLQVLDISGNPFGDKGAEIIANAIKEPYCSLVSLKMHSTRITDAAVTLLIEALEKNYTIAHIDLLQNQISPAKLHDLDSALIKRSKQKIKFVPEHVPAFEPVTFESVDIEQEQFIPESVTQSTPKSKPFLTPQSVPKPRAPAWCDPVVGNHHTTLASSSAVKDKDSPKRRWGLKCSNFETQHLEEDVARLKKKVRDLKQVVCIKEQVINKNQEDMRREGVKHREELKKQMAERVKSEESLLSELQQAKDQCTTLRTSLLEKDKLVVQLQHTVEHLKYVAQQKVVLQTQAQKLDDSVILWQKRYEDLKAEHTAKQKQQATEFKSIFEAQQKSQQREEELQELLAEKQRECAELSKALNEAGSKVIGRVKKSDQNPV